MQHVQNQNHTDLCLLHYTNISSHYCAHTISVPTTGFHQFCHGTYLQRSLCRKPRLLFQHATFNRLIVPATTITHFLKLHHVLFSNPGVQEMLEPLKTTHTNNCTTLCVSGDQHPLHILGPWSEISRRWATLQRSSFPPFHCTSFQSKLYIRHLSGAPPRPLKLNPHKFQRIPSQP